jgi:hypothetical protein
VTTRLQARASLGWKRQANETQRGPTRLPWAPPDTTGYTTVNVPVAGGAINLTAGQDYILQMPASPVTNRVGVTGGRNIVMIGGQIAIPNKGDSGLIQVDVPVGGTTITVDTTANWPASGTVRIGSTANGNDIEEKGYSSKTATSFVLTSGTANAHPAGSGTWPTISARQCAQFFSFTGIVHVEGLDFGGADASEGIQVNQLASPDAVYRMQNCRGGPMIQRDQASLLAGALPQDNHSDVIQAIGGPRQAQIAYCTFWGLDYQGLTWQPNSLLTGTKPTDLVDIRNTNIQGNGRSRYLLWQDDTPYFGEMRPSNVYMHTSGTGIHTNPSNSCWPAGKAWIDNVIDGDPPFGDFCPAGVAGIGYVSPGYL